MKTDHWYWTLARPLACEFITSMILIFNVCSLPWPGTHQMLTNENKWVQVLAAFNWGQRSNWILQYFRTFQTLPLIDSQEMPLMPAFTAGLSVFALLTMFHYVSVAHISPTARLSALHFSKKFRWDKTIMISIKHWLEDSQIWKFSISDNLFTVTFGFAFGGVFDWKLVIPYIIAQGLGAIAGAALAMVSFWKFHAKIDD